MTEPTKPLDMDLIDWAERMGLESLRAALAAIDAIKQETVTTLSVLMAAMAAALAYVIKGMDAQAVTPVVVGAAGLVVWLFVVGVLLVYTCLTVADAPSPTNRPRHLYQKDYALAKLREVELRNIDASIDIASARGASMARWLNGLRLAAMCSPIVFALIFFLDRAHLF